MGIPDIDLLKASFFGPWVPIPGTKNRVQHHYLSIAHWFESAKFMPARPDLRDAVLHCPSAKEARKFARARQAAWRSDWSLVRHSALVAGLGFLSLDRPDLNLVGLPGDALVSHLSGLKTPASFLTDCVLRFQAWGQGPRIATFGALTAPDGIVGKKLSKVVQNKPSWTLVSLCNSQTAWRVHDWALSHYIPVKYVGQPKLRSSASVLNALLESTDQLVVFELKGGKKADAIIQKARALKVSVSLELYVASELAKPSID
ncbi:hypothetical protein [Polaromonas sp. JS666]|uniref:hypothetical protein n=1 Tax=Polaromonas sp. (strain JS666 / ATCC BAA-500) TaxID=296591 RepID=UPI00005328DE|nr:hypothetical protein [Polaromonas sp. JS666]ABE46786.1 hypothetical protein Bpro_4910 [Polaromonas sp. JS666]